MGEGLFADSVSVYLAFAIDKSARLLVGPTVAWHSSKELIRNYVWEVCNVSMVRGTFLKRNTFSDSCGQHLNTVADLHWAEKVIKILPCGVPGFASQADAQTQSGFRE
jgi:hypothetical protein